MWTRQTGCEETADVFLNLYPPLIGTSPLMLGVLCSASGAQTLLVAAPPKVIPQRLWSRPPIPARARIQWVRLW
jgi:hypothetical protein